MRLLRGLVLVRLEEYERAVTELGELLPELEGLDEVEAVLARGRAAEWTEQTDLALEMAERAIALAERLDARELLGPAYGRLSQAYAMRGDDGDLDRAKETGDRALEIWIPATRTDELAEHNVMHGTPTTGSGDSTGPSTCRAPPASSPSTRAAERRSCEEARSREPRSRRWDGTRRRCPSSTRGSH
jgi:tetratricopeptide (TPR) repeat protein